MAREWESKTVAGFPRSDRTPSPSPSPVHGLLGDGPFCDASTIDGWMVLRIAATAGTAVIGSSLLAVEARSGDP